MVLARRPKAVSHSPVKGGDIMSGILALVFLSLYLLERKSQLSRGVE